MNNDRYQELFERFADAILIIENDRFVDCNIAAVKLLRYKSKAELLDTHPAQLSPEHQPDGQLSYEKANKMIAIAFEQGSQRFEWKHLRSDGAPLFVEVVLTAIKEGGHDTLHVVWRDISYLKKVENWQTEQIKILSVGANLGKCLTEVNVLEEMLQKCCEIFVEHLDAAFCRIWTLNAEDDVLELQASAGMYTHLDGAHSRIRMGDYKIGRIAKDQKPHQTINVIGDLQVHDQDWAKREGMVSFAGYPLVIDNRVVGVLAMFFRHEISDIVSKALASVSDELALGILRKQTDKKLHGNIEYLSSIIENIPNSVQLVDADGIILETNPAGLILLGASSKEAVVGRNIFDFVVNEDASAFQQLNTEVCSGKNKKLSFKINALDGTEHSVATVSVPLYYTPKGALVQLGIVQDLTSEIAAQAVKQELENQLSQAQKMESLGTLAGGIAHDFNNILTAIYGYAELAKGDADDSVKLQNDLDEVLHGADRAKELVKQILSFSRKTDHQLQPLRIQVIIKEVLKLLRSTLPTTIEIQQEICSDCAPILADPTKVHQVIMNLCTNAYHAMRSGSGCLRVRLAPVTLEGQRVVFNTVIPAGHFVKLDVEDTGSGIAEELLERIFEPYYTTKEQGEGTGLGLAVVHGIVESLNGKIAVSSEVGRGTIFSVYLPILQSGLDGKLKENTACQIPMGNGRILFVDDDGVIVSLQKKNLEALGYIFTGLTDSVKAFELFEKNPNNFDLLITDMTMPGLTGEELSRKILALRPEMPIILCTGYSDMINAKSAKELGIREFAEKPLTRNDLATIIRQALVIAR